MPRPEVQAYLDEVMQRGAGMFTGDIMMLETYEKSGYLPLAKKQREAIAAHLANVIAAYGMQYNKDTPDMSREDAEKTHMARMEELSKDPKLLDIGNMGLDELKEMLTEKGEDGKLRNLKPDKLMENLAMVSGKEDIKRNKFKGIADGLKQTTQKSFSGKLKSWFVGNSKEYDKAFKAMEKLSEGKATQAETKESIMAYLDIRKNKVRDHEYGRDRFDMMMRGLQTLMEPQEFADYCKGVDDARRARDPNYKGVTSPEDYMPDRSSQDLVNETAKQARKEGYEPTARETAKLLAAMQMGYADHDKPLNSRSVRERTDQIMADPDFQEWFNTREPGQIKKFMAEDPNKIGEYRHVMNQERGEREAKQAEAAEIEADFAELARKGGKGMGAPIQRKENFQREDFIEDDLFEELNKADLDKKLEQSKGPEL